MSSLKRWKLQFLVAVCCMPTALIVAASNTTPPALYAGLAITVIACIWAAVARLKIWFLSR